MTPETQSSETRLTEKHLSALLSAGCDADAAGAGPRLIAKLDDIASVVRSIVQGDKTLVDTEKWRRIIPTSWLDPLLTGPKAVLGDPPYTHRDIERLLNAIRELLSAATTPAAPETEDTK